MNNVINFNTTPMLQAIILNEKLLKVIREQEAKNREFEAKMDKKIKKENEPTKKTVQQ